MKKLSYWALLSAVVLLGFGCKPTEPEVPTEPQQPELTPYNIHLEERINELENKKH